MKKQKNNYIFPIKGSMILIQDSSCHYNLIYDKLGILEYSEYTNLFSYNKVIESLIHWYEENICDKWEPEKNTRISEDDQFIDEFLSCIPDINEDDAKNDEFRFIKIKSWEDGNFATDENGNITDNISELEVHKRAYLTAKKYFDSIDIKKNLEDNIDVHYTEKSFWHKPSEKPDNGITILCRIWYDRYNYVVGTYNKETNSILTKDGFNNTIELDDFDDWAYIPEEATLKK